MSRVDVPGGGSGTGSGIGHLARRFLWSMRTRGVEPDDDRWARGRLSPSELRLWESMDPVDRAHSVAVARRVARWSEESGTVIPSWVMTAALLHDVGKCGSDLPTWARVITAVLDRVVPTRTAVAWARREGTFGRIGRHLTYTDLGASMLDEAGSDPRVAAWAREHHRRPEEWSVDRALGEVLAWADRGATRG